MLFRSNVFYDIETGYAYDPDKNMLLDEATGNYYDLATKERIDFIGGFTVYPGRAQSPDPVPEGLKWDSERGYITKDGMENLIYDVNSGWLVDPESQVYYEASYGYAYDPTQNNLIDMTTGNRYTMQYEPIVNDAIDDALEEAAQNFVDGTTVATDTAGTMPNEVEAARTNEEYKTVDQGKQE